MRNAGLEETQAGIKIAGRNINNLRYADDTTLMADIFQIFTNEVSFFSFLKFIVLSGVKKLLDESDRGEWKGLLKAQHSEN